MSNSVKLTPCGKSDATDASAIQNIMLPDFLEFYDSFLGPNSSLRKKLSVHLFSQKIKEEGTEKLPGSEVITDESVFKAGLVTSPAAVPIWTEKDLSRL